MNSVPTCRSCGQTPLTTVLSLGCTPLANALRDETAADLPEPTFPLELAVCGRCSLAQLTTEVPPEVLFREYVYFSSFSETMLQHAAHLAAELIRQEQLGPSRLVVEAASNDGYLLKNYRAAGIPVLGIEPARNIAQVAIEHHAIPTRTEFFSLELAKQLVREGLRADVFHAHNVLAHVPDLNGFVAGIHTLLKPTGVAVIEVPYVRDMLEQCEFDTIYHEHLCYFSLTALVECFQRQGLVIRDVQRVPIHGGSLRLFAAPVEGGPAVSSRVTALLAEEARWGVATLEPYRAFAQKVRTIQHELRAFLTHLKAQGKRIAAYGASAKGSTLLNSCGIGAEVIDFVVDRSPVKQGKYTPGTRLKIYSPDQLLHTQPDYTLLLTWNFAEEILRQQAEYRRRGGKFIVPVPQLRVA
ncbi:MAG: class I SAM-dependent methyltransferase [Gemmataceae bacterium]|nr:class I SAM-dependent methyltransferase [Gemmata sp.]MDW8197805.1 class I SAM-dependent methyltransferase [Gemmataceae bacterium]